jgi:chemotaxis protein methyltransferase CheR
LVAPPTSTPRQAKSLSRSELAQIRDLAYRRSGIDLREDKEHLVSIRMSKHMRQMGYATFQDMMRQVKGDSTGETLLALIDALTTNHTSFLREKEHFDLVKGPVFDWMKSRGTLRLWCAASSTGEEPYTLLFTLLDSVEAAFGAHVGMAQRVEMLATDISNRVLDMARKGVYSEERLKNVPDQWRRKYFQRGTGQWEGHYRVRPELAARIRFQRFNLMDPVPADWRYPVIFCRNVMIYFDRQTQAAVVDRLARTLEPGGYLFVGHAESLAGIDHALAFVKPAVYRRQCGAGRDGTR